MPAERMHLPESCINEFRDLWKENTGEDLSLDDASDQAEALLLLLKEAIFPSNRDPP